MLAFITKHDPLCMVYVSRNDTVIDYNRIFSDTRRFSNHYLITSRTALIIINAFLLAILSTVVILIRDKLAYSC
jgi:hypothetical protein